MERIILSRLCFSVNIFNTSTTDIICHPHPRTNHYTLEPISLTSCLIITNVEVVSIDLQYSRLVRCRNRTTYIGMKGLGAIKANCKRIVAAVESMEV